MEPSVVGVGLAGAGGHGVFERRTRGQCDERLPGGSNVADWRRRRRRGNRIRVLARPVVFIHYPHSNPHPSQMGRVWIENNYPLKKWVGWVWGWYK
jgi:hypothetical protein